jgi:NAD+-dependent secondary alcohol dehydrogenase Adh1
MSTMRAVQVVGYHQNLEMKEVPAPTPTGPFDVVIKIGGAGVCRTDLHILEGQWAEKTNVQLRHTIGHENAGWVDAVGPAVTNVREGDKVIVHPLITCGLCRACRSGDDVHCEANAFPGIDTNGGYADYLKTSARSVVKIDDSLEPSDIAALADAGLTAYHAAAKAARRLTPRDKCVIIGAGGLGHIGIQVLKALTPAELIVVDRNAEALKLAESIGADHGVLADGSQVEQVLELTGGNGAEAVVDFVGEGGATSEGVQCCGARAITTSSATAEHQRAHDRHGLHRDQLHRQPGRVLQRPVCLMALRPAARGPARRVQPGRFPVRHHRSRLRQCPRPGHPPP